MRSISILAILLLSIFFTSCSSNNSSNMEQSSILRHMVFFKFKDNASSDDIKKVHDAFAALPNNISVIKDFEWGLNNSPENLHQGLTHCYMLSFESEADRDKIYLPHPKHQEFGKELKPILDKVVVVDYWTNK